MYTHSYTSGTHVYTAHTHTQTHTHTHTDGAQGFRNPVHLQGAFKRRMVRRLIAVKWVSVNVSAGGLLAYSAAC